MTCDAGQRSSGRSPDGTDSEFTQPRGIVSALQNGVGVVLSKLAIISIPFLLSAIGFLLNSTLEARDFSVRQAIQGIGQKVDELSTRVDGLASVLNDSRDLTMSTAGDMRALQVQQRALEKRFDERWRK